MPTVSTTPMIVAQRARTTAEGWLAPTRAGADLGCPPVDELRVRLLGGLQVEGLEAKQVGSRKARTLLAALAVARGAPVGADALADVLWGEELPAKPSDQVGVLVSRLRGVLGTDRILRTDAGYALRADWLDVAELEARGAEATEHLRAGAAVDARLLATMALDVARGPLLPEEEGPWIDGPRAAVDRLLSSAALVAAEAALATGDTWGAVAAANVGLQRDPYDEAALRALMRAHAAAGRPASALAAYAEARTRLAEDLGVSPARETETLHQELLGEEPAAIAAPEPPRPPAGPPEDVWDPLVHRARRELERFDVEAAQRDAEEAVRRGAGPGALELAGWIAYYRRDFAAALRWAEEAAAQTTEEERRESCLTLSARVLHSSGDLSGAEVRLTEAARSATPGVRGVAEVELGGLRVHQGRPEDALALVDRGATDAAVLRHPFVLPRSFFWRAYALGAQGRVADLFHALDRFDAALEDDLGSVTRYRPAAANLRSWALAAVGARDEARSLSEQARAETSRFDEPRAHATLDLAQLSLDAGDEAGAAAWLERAEVPEDDDAGTMVWAQRHRAGLLAARLCWRTGDAGGTEAAARGVLDDARRRGGARHAAQAELLVLLARVRQGEAVSHERIERTLGALDRMAGLEGWRATAEVAAATRASALRQAAQRRATFLVDRAGDHATVLGRWIDQELTRLGVG
jgi:DNA-binding SARP family transcriptional activator